MEPHTRARLLPWMDTFCRYFDAEVRGFEHVPKSGPVLFIGNHSGGLLTPDTTALITSWYRNRIDPLTLLGLDAVFYIPGFGALASSVGVVPASHDNARRALEAGRGLVVYPGGAHEVYRPWRDRNRVDFGGHKGFVRMALRAGIPVHPVIGHGGHENIVVLARGSRLSRWSGLASMRVQVCPIVLQIPWGISTPAAPPLPLPTKITVQIDKPIDWTLYGPEAADDPVIVQRCYDEITERMQVVLSAMSAENPHPVRRRLGDMLRSVRA
jgi:1-acyl-sn-glycerol-3-phosphate acyltransferase